MGFEHSRLMKVRSDMMTGNGRKRSYGMLFVLAFCAALICVVILQKMRENRVLDLVIQRQEQQMISLNLLLQKEKERKKQMQNKFEELKGKTISSIKEKNELNDKLMETESKITDVRRAKQDLEAALQEKEERIKQLAQKAEQIFTVNKNVTVLTELLKHKEAELEAMKIQLEQVENDRKENTLTNHIAVKKDNLQDRNLDKHITKSQEKIIYQEDIQINNVNRTEAEHEVTRRVGEWVNFRTDVDNKEFDDKTGSLNDTISVDISNGELPGKLEVPKEIEDSEKKEKITEENILSKPSMELEDKKSSVIDSKHIKIVKNDQATKDLINENRNDKEIPSDVSSTETRNSHDELVSRESSVDEYIEIDQRSQGMLKTNSYEGIEKKGISTNKKLLEKMDFIGEDETLKIKINELARQME